MQFIKGDADAGGAVSTEQFGLRSLLGGRKRRSTSGNTALSRKQRLATAAAANWAVLYRCGTPWLPSDWHGNDDLRLLFRNMNQRDRRGHTHAAVLADHHTVIPHKFKPAASLNVAPPADVAEGIQNRQIRNRALFTLGALPVELCLDKTFEKVCQESKESDFGVSLEAFSNTPSVPPPSDFDIATGCIDEVFLI